MENPIPIRLPMVIDSRASSFIKGIIKPAEEADEPSEELSFTLMLAHYKEQAKEKKEDGAEFFVISELQTLSELRAAVIACTKHKLPVYVTVEADEFGFTSAGTPVLALLISLQNMGISAFGLNCSYEPEKTIEILKGLAPFAQKPLIADFSETEPNEIIKLKDNLLESNVELIIGDFNHHSMQKKAISDILKGYDYSLNPIEKQDTSLILANETQVFFLSADGIESSEPLSCNFDMSNELLEISDTNIDLITIEILTPDDAYQFSQNAHMARLPIMFKTDNEPALKAALLMYHGRAMVDSSSAIDEEILKKIAAKYGAVIY